MDVLTPVLRKLYPISPFKNCVFIGSNKNGINYIDYPNLNSIPDIDFASFINTSENFYRDAKYVLYQMIQGGVMAFYKHTDQSEKFYKDFSDNLDILHMEDVAVFQIKRKYSLIFHVYAFNWNEERLLPHFFNHYKDADRIFIMDNKSDDKSLEIIKSNKNTTVLSFDTDGKLDSHKHQAIENDIWKNSRNVADYVIIQNLDEFVFFPEYPADLRRGLIEFKNNKITICKCVGYNMACTDLEFNSILPNQYLSSTLVKGNYSQNHCKIRCFNPNEVKETNFGIGAHECSPIGNLKYPPEKSLLLLHYHFVGLEYIKQRVKLLESRVSQDKKLNSHLTSPESELFKVIEARYNECIKVDNFRNMYPNCSIQLIEFNNQSCVIDTFGGLNDVCYAIKNKEIWMPPVADYIKFTVKTQNYTFLNFDSTIGYYSILAKLSGCNETYTFTDNRISLDKIKNTCKINGWDNFNVFLRNIYLPEVKNNNIIVKISDEDLDCIFDIGDILKSEKTKTIIIGFNIVGLSLKYFKEIVDFLQEYEFNKMTVLFSTNENFAGLEIKQNTWYPFINYEDLIKRLANNIHAEIAFLR